MNAFIIKNHIQETHLFKVRIIAAILFTAIFTVILISRLIYLQGFQSKHFVTLSNKNKIDLVPIAPRRGIIYDRNGMVIAKNIPVFNLVVVPNKVSDLENTLIEIRKIIPLNETEIKQFYSQLKQHRRFEEIQLKLKLTNNEVARFSVNRYKFPGVSVKAQLIRYYPLSNALVHVLGYVGRINEQELMEIDPTNYFGTNFIGKLGIERYYEELLHGKVGYRKVETDASGRVVRTISELPPMRGRDLYLTIDSHLQIVAEKALGQEKGAVVIIQPNTGEILALVSQPTYNPNLFVSGIEQKDYTVLQNDTTHPLHNRTIRGLYAPGSTIKPFIALAGLNSSIITKKFKIFDPGWYKLPNAKHIYHDWRPTGHGLVNLEKAIVQSCDTYFYNLSYKLGIKRIDEMLELFGFGQKTGIEIKEEFRGNLPTPEWKLRYRGRPWYTGDTIVIGIGQGYMQVTPLQLAVAISILANRGISFTPHLLYALKKPDEEINYVEPVFKSLIQLKKSKYWSFVISAMSKVISEGTGHRFGKVNYSIAAKTGTAQVVNTLQDRKGKPIIPIQLRNNSIFIAFAPITKPKIAIAVVVESNTLAINVARKVLDYYFSANI